MDVLECIELASIASRRHTARAGWTTIFASELQKEIPPDDHSRRNYPPEATVRNECSISALLLARIQSTNRRCKTTRATLSINYICWLFVAPAEERYCKVNMPVNRTMDRTFSRLRLPTVLCSLVLIVEFLTCGWFISATQVIFTNIETSQFNILKTADNDAVCAIDSTPFMNLSASPMYCASRCQQQATLSSCSGFNYRSSGSTCEFFNSTQSMFGLRRGCRYFKVLILICSYWNL